MARAVPVSNYVPPAKHVFVINIENKGYAETWGRLSKAPYLAHTLRNKGVLLYNYYGTAHNSQPNYIAQISGQAPNPQMQGDCQIYSSFSGSGTQAPQQAVGTGCVFPTSVNSLPIQLDRGGYSWRGYMQDMKTPCLHPTLNSQDNTQKAGQGRPVRDPAQPVHVLHVDHRPGELLQAACRQHQRARQGPALGSHHAQPHATSRRTCAPTGTTHRASTDVPAA